jgi:hypothetical protein
MLALKVAIAEHGWGSNLKALLLDFHPYQCYTSFPFSFQEPLRAAETYCYARDLVPYVPQLRSLEAVKIRAGALRQGLSYGSEARQAMHALVDAFLQPGAFPNLRDPPKYDEQPLGNLGFDEGYGSKLCLPRFCRGRSCPTPMMMQLQDHLRPEIQELDLHTSPLVSQFASAMMWWRTGLFSTLRVLNLWYDREVNGTLQSILDCLAAGACPALRELGLIAYTSGWHWDWRPIGAKLESMGKHLKVERLRLGLMDDEALAKALMAGALPHLKTLVITSQRKVDVRASWTALRERIDRVPGIRIIVGSISLEIFPFR